MWSRYRMRDWGCSDEAFARTCRTNVICLRRGLWWAAAMTFMDLGICDGGKVGRPRVVGVVVCVVVVVARGMAIPQEVGAPNLQVYSP